jgi:hypothetical protein
LTLSEPIWAQDDSCILKLQKPRPIQGLRSTAKRPSLKDFKGFRFGFDLEINHEIFEHIIDDLNINELSFMQRPDTYRYLDEDLRNYADSVIDQMLEDLDNLAHISNELKEDLLAGLPEIQRIEQMRRSSTTLIEGLEVFYPFPDMILRPKRTGNSNPAPATLYDAHGNVISEQARQQMKLREEQAILIQRWRELLPGTKRAFFTPDKLPRKARSLVALAALNQNNTHYDKLGAGDTASLEAKAVFEKIRFKSAGHRADGAIEIYLADDISIHDAEEFAQLIRGLAKRLGILRRLENPHLPHNVGSFQFHYHISRTDGKNIVTEIRLLKLIRYIEIIALGKQSIFDRRHYSLTLSDTYRSLLRMIEVEHFESRASNYSFESELLWLLSAVSGTPDENMRLLLNRLELLLTPEVRLQVTKLLSGEMWSADGFSYSEAMNLIYQYSIVFHFEHLMAIENGPTLSGFPHVLERQKDELQSLKDLGFHFDFGLLLEPNTTVAKQFQRTNQNNPLPPELVGSIFSGIESDSFPINIQLRDEFFRLRQEVLNADGN